MALRRFIARAFFKLSGWTCEGTVPREGILVGAPHTSYWDFWFTLMVTWRSGVSPKLLMKEELFIGPVGWFLRKLGGFPVRRKSSTGLVQQIIDQADAARAAGKPFVLAIAAEGTRSQKDFWKSGFYHMAHGTGLPIGLAYIDGPSKRVGMGPIIQTTGDMGADMDKIRAFYADKRGLHPEGRTEPRLREEDATS